MNEQLHTESDFQDYPAMLRDIVEYTPPNTTTEAQLLQIISPETIHTLRTEQRRLSWGEPIQLSANPNQQT